MRLSIRVSLLATASLLVSCANIMVGDIRVYGWALNRVTRADVEAAIRADQAEHEHNDRITEVDVVSRDQINIYHGPRLASPWFHCVIERIDGKWRYTGKTIYTS
jgi:hypothetical protein